MKVESFKFLNTAEYERCIKKNFTNETVEGKQGVKAILVKFKEQGKIFAGLAVDNYNEGVVVNGVTKNEVSSMKYQKTKEVLNQLVADLSQMAMVIHQTHWYMRGTNFLKLHPLMDEFMDEINDQLDVISERLITLDGEPFSTLSEMSDHTGIKDEKGSFGKGTPERLATLVKDYRYLEDLYQKGIEVSDEEKDYSTQDIFIGFKTEIEKKIWMIQAELNEAPEIDA